ncbi:MAG: caspase family protein, partial [candidate division NC10 bacterium]
VPIGIKVASEPGRANLKRLLDESLAAASPAPPAPAEPAPAFNEGRMQQMIETAVKNASRREEAAPKDAALKAESLKPGFRLAERPRDFALVVGVDGYSSLTPARFAERDAAAFAEHMKALGVPERNTVRLSGSQASYTALKKYLESWLPKNVSPDSRVYFFFSGHGAPDTATHDAYLVPWDGDPAFLEDTAYPLKRLYQKLGALKAKEVIVAMDACFSGAGGRSVLTQGARPLVMKLNQAPIPPGLTVFAAALDDQITGTLEDQGHGAFTYYLLKGLGGGAKDASGRVTTGSLYGYLKPKVQDAARRQNRDQESVMHGQADRELVRF